MTGATARRERLVTLPAGIFFALAALVAAALPWLFSVLPPGEALLAHIRLGIFGFGGLAVAGYLLTALRAWVGRDPPLPALALAVLAFGARMATLGAPEPIWPVLLPSLVIAVAILWPVLAAGCWARLPLAAVPLALALAEAALVGGRIGVEWLPIAMAALILMVGGRIVPAFLAADRRRRNLPSLPQPALWPGPAILAVGLLVENAVGAAALTGAALWVLHRVRGGLGAGPACRMLCLGYAGLAPGLFGLLAARFGLLPEQAGLHLLTMAVMGPMILAVAARVTMRRAGGELLPLKRHWAALWLLYGAAAARGLAALVSEPGVWMTLAGVGWSAAWMLFLSAHLAALARPAPFPLLSAGRPAPAGA